MDPTELCDLQVEKGAGWLCCLFGAVPSSISVNPERPSALRRSQTGWKSPGGRPAPSSGREPKCSRRFLRAAVSEGMLLRFPPSPGLFCLPWEPGDLGGKEHTRSPHCAQMRAHVMDLGCTTNLLNDPQLFAWPVSSAFVRK